MVLRQASMDPTPLDSEAVLSLISLAHTDNTFIIPIAVGLITMANVEANTIFRRAAAVAGGKEHRTGFLDSALRGLSLVRVGITALTPGVCVHIARVTTLTDS